MAHKHRATPEDVLLAVKAGVQQKTEAVITPVSAADIQEMQDIIHLDIANVVHTFDNYAVNHILRRHGNPKIEQAHGQLAITCADFDQLIEIITMPDYSVYGAKNERGQELVGRIKTLKDGTVLYIEELRQGRKALALASMRKYPAAKNAPSIARSVLLNVRNDGGGVLTMVERATGVKTTIQKPQHRAGTN